MPTQMILLIASLTLAFSSNVTRAQEAAVPTKPVVAESISSANEQNADQSVEISNAKNPEWKSYRSMLRGLEAFERFHTKAPLAEPKFVVRPRAEGLSMEGLTLHVKSDQSSLPIPLAEGGYFVLPRDAQADADDADLMLNRKKKLYRWQPAIRTPALPIDQLRLGDLRLACEMEWAIEKDGAPFVFRMFLNAAGGFCRSSKLTVSIPTPYLGAQSVTLVQANRRLNLPLNTGKFSFVLPIHDQAYSDDTMIEIVYDEPNVNLRKPNLATINIGF
jgi:hypothetical protein